MDMVIRIVPEDRMALRVEGRTETRWSGRYRFLLADGRRSGVSKLLVEGKLVAPGEEVYCDAGPLRWSYRIDDSFRAGDSSYAVLGDVALAPFPWPDGPPAVCFEAGRGVLIPGAAGSSKVWTNRLVFWGEFECFDNLRVAAGFPAPLPHHRDGIRRIESYLANLFGYHPFPDSLHSLFPVLPDAGPGGFCGSGLAGQASTILFLPGDYRLMDFTGFLWLAAHEIAHLWIGVSIRFPAELLWLVEGLAAYYALLAVCNCASVAEEWLRKMIAISLNARENLSMHWGLLAALAADLLQENCGEDSLRHAISGLVRTRRESRDPLTWIDFERALTGLKIQTDVARP
jgi:hypothetical protein